MNEKRLVKGMRVGRRESIEERKRVVGSTAVNRAERVLTLALRNTCDLKLVIKGVVGHIARRSSFCCTSRVPRHERVCEVEMNSLDCERLRYRNRKEASYLDSH